MHSRPLSIRNVCRRRSEVDAKLGAANRRTSKAPKDKEIKKKVDAPKVKFEMKLLGDTILASKYIFIIKLVKLVETLVLISK